ncbi:hypothetical protein SPRG_10250 [Saprolegnia parasitica CBS 223.65]|uniref:Ion transport domain-containing protein n=1 Tax=Saprolegnia parasitica (strain CBS 223.65) TaxID=695850 RepID=A0A067CDX1_SAPPC|nr:hypothetical protein SPRG_10250 [Saprolegnia parasitica CBS 223.65]KDO24716.1 hypothetical protein SPRG_10250 [Saprolegnia parasitica CBS 223.65]|eukprot:XP_012204596.1 hypothetical protein SPRG_10250 [Saprolegnia parasitica CBS 223.65]
MATRSGVGPAPIQAARLTALSDSALLLSRVLERETRKQSVIKRVRQPAGRRLAEASLLRKDSTSRGWSLLRNVPISKTIADVRRGSRLGLPFIRVESRLSGLRRRIWSMFNDPMSSLLGRYISFVLLCAVFAGSLIFVLQTEPSLSSFAEQLTTAEHVCIYLFSVEFVVRIACAPDYVSFFWVRVLGDYG